MTDTTTETTTPAESKATRIFSRRIDKTNFTKIVRENFRPGRPAFAALARELGAALGIEIVLVEPRKCERCGKSFLPTKRNQKYDTNKCSGADRIERFRKVHGIGATKEESPSA